MRVDPVDYEKQIKKNETVFNFIQLFYLSLIQKNLKYLLNLKGHQK